MQKTMMTALGVSLLTGAFFLGVSSAQAATAQSIHAVRSLQNTSHNWDCTVVPINLQAECITKNRQQNQDMSGNPILSANQDN